MTNFAWTDATMYMKVMDLKMGGGRVTADILTCHSRKIPSSPYNINNG